VGPPPVSLPTAPTALTKYPTACGPADYLELFAGFVRENVEQGEAVGILLGKPKGWGAAALTELRDRLTATPERFTEDKLRTVHQARYKKPLVDIISMVKHAARESEPLLTAAERG
jgi:type I restriction enzyme R subunit